MKNLFLRTVCAFSVLGLSCAGKPAFAIDDSVSDLQVSKRGDIEMSCGELSEEVALMDDIIATTQDIRDQSKMKENGIGVAGAAASFLVGTLTGGLGIAAAGYFANEAVEDKGDSAESVQDIAEQRRSFVTGIYNSKGCLGPIDRSEKDPLEEAQAPSDEKVAAAEPAAGDPKPAARADFYNQ